VERQRHAHLRAGKKEITHREIGVRLNLAGRVTHDQRHSADATRLFLAHFENYAITGKLVSSSKLCSNSSAPLQLSP
jgi:hypothetical protein